MVEKIFTGKDHALRYGLRSHADWILATCKRMNSGGQKLLDPAWTGQIREGAEPAEAFISEQRWCALCPDCGASEYADPEERIFYCFNCANASIRGDARPILFPPDHTKIEGAVLARKVRQGFGPDPISRAMGQQPEGQPRAWYPNKSVRARVQRLRGTRK